MSSFMGKMVNVFHWRERVKLNIVVYGSKWLRFFTRMKRVKGKTDFTP